MLIPPPLPPLAVDPTTLLAPLGVAVLTVTLLRRVRLRSKQAVPEKQDAPATDPAAAVREAVRRSAGAWELRLHDAGRAAEASLETRAAELESLSDRAEAAAASLRSADLPEPPATLPLPGGDDRVWRHLRQAGYDDRQIAVLLDRDGEGERRRAA